MTLSDRLVEARFTKRADGNWDYAPFPFACRRVLEEDRKCAMIEFLKDIQPGMTLFFGAACLQLPTLTLGMLILTLGEKLDFSFFLIVIAIVSVSLFALPAAKIYMLIRMIRSMKSPARNSHPLKGAPKGERVGYVESMTRIGRTLGPVYTLLILSACASATVFAAIDGSLATSVLEEVAVPILISAALLPLFWSGLRRPTKVVA